MNFNIKKLSNLSIYLYIIFFILFKYIDNKSFFDFNILKETFNKHELTENFPIKNKYFESIILIKSNNLMSYRLSNEIIDDVYTKYKIGFFIVLFFLKFYWFYLILEPILQGEFYVILFYYL